MAGETQTFSREMILSAYKAALQLSRILYKSALFMQNKANFRRGQMNVKSFQTTDYDDFCRFELGKNKANSKPIKANLKRAKMNVNSLTTKDYRKNDDFAVQKNKPNSNPIQSQSKPISDYPCVFELAEYNLVFRDGNVMHSMPNGRNFDGEYVKWQMHRKQTQ